MKREWDSGICVIIFFPVNFCSKVFFAKRKIISREILFRRVSGDSPVSNDKKWFLYVDGKNEGPFSISELQSRRASGGLTTSSFVWCEGMADWIEAAQVSELAALFSAGAAPGFDTTRMAGADGTIASGGPILSAASGPQIKEMETRGITLSGVDPVTIATQAGIRPSAAGPSSFAKKGSGVSSKTGLVILVTILILVTGGALAATQGLLDPLLASPAVKAISAGIRDSAGPTILKLVDRFPGLAAVYPPIPSLEDVSSEDLAELQSAAIGLPADVGPKLGLALSSAEGPGPVLYASSNLPEGAKVELLLEGLQDTLVRQVSGSVKVTGIVEKRLFKSQAIKGTDGQALPRGEYMISIYESDPQPEAVSAILSPMPVKNLPKISAEIPKGRKLLVRRMFFLGGKKDASYQKQLQEVHETLKNKAKAELEETKQLSATLENQLKDSLDHFKRFKTMKNAKAAQKSWSEFHTKWTALDAKLAEAFQKWTPEVVSTQLFYGMIYNLVIQAGQAVVKAHGMHHAYFTGGAPDPKAFQIQQGEAVASAEAAVNSLKAKIEAAEKITPSPAGLPRREGL